MDATWMTQDIWLWVMLSVVW